MDDTPDILWHQIREANRYAPADRPQLLVVEDDAESRLHVQYVLRHEVRTDVATTVAEALRMARARDYDGVLIGRQLADDLSRQMIDRLRARANDQTVPMIVVTDPADSDAPDESVDAGFEARVTGPLQGQELRALVQRLLAGADNEGAERTSGDGLPGKTEADEAVPVMTANRA